MREPERGSPPKRRKARATLSVREPLVETLLAGGFDGENVEELRGWCKALVQDRNRWDVNRRRSGIFGTRRLDKAEATRLLTNSIKELEADNG